MDFLQLHYTLDIQNFYFYAAESPFYFAYMSVIDVNLKQISLFPRHQAKDEPVQRQNLDKIGFLHAGICLHCGSADS